MNNNVNDYFNNHEKRTKLTLNLQYIYGYFSNVAVFGFSDVDMLIMKAFDKKKISFIVPEEFRKYLKDDGKDYIFADIAKEIPKRDGCEVRSGNIHRGLRAYFCR